ncbi:MAG: outer membrane beta-barrel protein [Verrucomicrobiota bacterium]
MKKLITSAGFAVLGAASLNAQQIYAPAPGLTTTQLSKPWSVSAAIRGFYDDNYALTPSKGIVLPNGTKVKPQDSYGYEVTPSVGLNWTMEQTYLGLGYVYSLKYFENRVSDKYDQSHQANLKLSHAFTDRYKLDLTDSFVLTREPDLIAPSNAANATIRSRQDVLRNYGAASFTAGLSDRFSAVLGYSNTLYDFRDDGAGSLSALLDRMEHLISANLRYQVQPSTVALIGYQYGIMDFTGDENTLIFIDPNNPGRGTLQSDDRSNHSHYVYVGVDHNFNPQLDGSVRIGAQFTTYDNLPTGDDNNVSPYADANLTYRMTPDSAVQVGIRHSRIATDAAALDQENTTIYGSVSYRVLPPLTASLLSQFQFNDFGEGRTAAGVSPVSFKDKGENFWLVGLNLTYEINRFLAAEAGYNYDRLDSDIGFRSFTRNRVYVGLRASY